MHFAAVRIVEGDAWMRETQVGQVDFIKIDVEGADMRSPHDPDDAYHVMYHHIVNNFRSPKLIGAFAPSRLPKN